VCRNSACTNMGAAARRENSPSSRAAQRVWTAHRIVVRLCSSPDHPASARPAAPESVIIVTIASVKKACASHSRIRTSSQGPRAFVANADTAATDRTANRIGSGTDTLVECLLSLLIACAMFFGAP